MLKSCERCGGEFKTSNSKARYCGLSCFGKANREGKPPVRVRAEPQTCCVCGGPRSRNTSKYCSNDCQQVEALDATLRDVVASGVAPSRPGTLRKIMLKLLPHKCAVCSGETWMGQPIPLEVDHIDGNYTNNTLENLRLVCGNCGMLLPTYKAKNWGNGRYMRRVRYSQGKSY